MSLVINREHVLVTNAVYQAIGTVTIKKALTNLNSAKDGYTYKALQLEYDRKPDGSWNFETPIEFALLSFEDWIKLPVRDFDTPVHTPKLTIRAPTVIVATKYAKVPKKQLKPTRTNLKKRDKNRCQYTGKLLTKKTMTIDHVIPRSRGGNDSWENLVSAHKDVNSKKGNKLNSEAGLKLLAQPKAPKAQPVCFTITDIKHPDWYYILGYDDIKRKNRSL